MPWLLLTSFSTSPPEWTYVDSATAPPGFREHDFIPSLENLRDPIQIRLDKGSPDANDFARAPDDPNVVVSEAFKNVIQGVEPHAHHFLPVQLLRADQSADDRKFFILKVGTYLDDAIDVSQSDLGIRTRIKERYYPLKNPPRVMWRASKVKGRHLWADSKLKDHMAVSDEVYSQLQNCGLRGFVAKESRIDDTL